MPNDAAALIDEQLKDLLDATESDLRKTYLEMQKPDWLLALAKLKKEGANDPAKAELHKKALKAELAVLDAIQEIDAADLAAIATKLEAEAPALRAARKELQQAKEHMEDVAKAINAVAKVLGVLTKVLVTVGKLIV